VAGKNNLSYPVLADTDNTLASKFGLVFTLPDALQQLYTNFGIDLVRFNGNDSWTLPLPARFIIDPTGKIRDVQVHPDYTVRPEPSQIPDIIRTLAN
jgi:peroxiredoxin